MSDTNIFTIFRTAPDQREFKAGDTIFQEGQPGEVMYAVVEGQVDIVKQEVVVESLGVGAIFGEMAIVDHEPRGASAVAATDCKVAEVSEKRFNFLVQQTPFFALQVMRVLAQRLRRTR